MIKRYIDFRDTLEEEHIGPTKFLKCLKKYINDICKDGYRFNGLIYSRAITDGAAFVFEEDEPCQYDITFDDEVSQYINECNINGRIISDDHIIKIYEKIGNIHSVVLITNVVDRPIFFIKVENPSKTDPNKVSLYEQYYEEMKKNALWRGQETKGFIQWEFDKRKKNDEM